MEPIPGTENERRLRPRLWDYNCVLMTQLVAAMRDLLQSVTPNMPEGATIVDYGCGTRPYEPIFEAMSPSYVAADFAGNSEADVVLAEDGRLPLPDQSADLVLSSQVLEHVANVDLYLAECRRVLKPGGILLLSTHGMWTYHPFPQDLRRWTWAGLLHDIERCGFRIGGWQGCLGPLAYTAQLRLQLVRGFLYQVGWIGRLLVPPVCLLSQLWMGTLDRITPAEVRKMNSTIYVVLARRPN